MKSDLPLHIQYVIPAYSCCIMMPLGSRHTCPLEEGNPDWRLVQQSFGMKTLELSELHADYLSSIYGGFLKWGYPPIISFDRSFHDKLSILGIPIYGPPYKKGNHHNPFMSKVKSSPLISTTPWWCRSASPPHKLCWTIEMSPLGLAHDLRFTTELRMDTSKYLRHTYTTNYWHIWI